MINSLFKYIVFTLSVAFLCGVPMYGQVGNSSEATHPDSVAIPLNIRLGVDLASPVIYLIDKKNITLEGYASVDWNEKLTSTLNAGYAKSDIDEYNYNYSAEGFYVKPGVELNLLKPQIGEGLYFAGIGVKYGIHSYFYKTSDIIIPNYWGEIHSNLRKHHALTHSFEVSAGFSVRVAKHIAMGWRASLIKAFYTSSKGEVAPMYVPGYGYRDSSVNVGFRYFIAFNISHKTIKAKWKEKKENDFEALEQGQGEGQGRQGQL